MFEVPTPNKMYTSKLKLKENFCKAKSKCSYC